MDVLKSRQQQYNETHKRIFDAAMELFARENYENITISKICKKASVSVGAFYHHYQSKENIINEGYRQFDNVVEEKMKSRVFSNSEEAIYFLIECQLQSMQDLGVFSTIQYFKNQLTTKEKYIINTDRYFYVTLNDYVSQWLKEHNSAIESTIVVEEILRATRGTIYDWCLHDGAYDLVKYGMKTARMILYYYAENVQK